MTYPLCTIANTPRLPEHCIEYVKVIQWPKENPFETNLDGDDPTHLNWVFEKSQERASQFNIIGVTFRLVQGVVKNIIPAVASTNAVIAAACATEVFKLATSCCLPLNNYMVFNDVDGIYTYTYEAERRSDCLACSLTPITLAVEDCNIKLEQLIEKLTDSHEYQMRNPGITAMVDGKSRTLYLPTVSSIEEKTRPNLKKTLKELNLVDGCQLLVADLTNPNTLQMTLKYSKLTEMVVD